MLSKFKRNAKSLIFYFLIILGIYWLISFIEINKFKQSVEVVSRTLNITENGTEKMITKNTLDIIREQEYLQKIKKSKFLFIGGFPKSGTTLLRSIMDVHDSISCGPDPHYLPEFLNFFPYLNEDFQYDDVNRIFIYFVLKKHFNSFDLGRKISLPKKIDRKNTILCLKEPSLLFHFKYLNQLFPKSKIVYLVRDGRDVAFSLIQSLGLDRVNENFMTILKLWNDFNEIAYEQCNLIGSNCIMIKYEDLIESRVKNIRIILGALEIKYMREMLHHEDFINKRIFFEINDQSAIEVIEKINQDFVKKWIGQIEYDKTFVNNTINMLNKLGYKINFNDENDGKNNFVQVSNNSEIISYEKLKKLLI